MRPSAEAQYPNTIALRQRLIQDKTLIEHDGVYVFMKDVEFTSPSAAAAVIHGGSANGLTAWKDKNGKSLKELEEAYPFAQADTPRHATLGPHFILAQARHAAVCRLAQTLGPTGNPHGAHH